MSNTTKTVAVNTINTSNPTKSTNKETLCWTCQFCTGVTKPHEKSTLKNGVFQCPWVARHEPVPGWDATKTNLKVAPNQITESYCVHNCAYYKPDLEAQIAALSLEQIANRLEVSVSFVKGHQKLTKQVLYTYTKQYSREFAQLTAANPEAKRLSAKDRYEMKVRIIKDLLIFSQESLADMETSGDSSQDETDYMIQLRQTIDDCQDMLTNLQYHYKHRKNKRSAAAN